MEQAEKVCDEIIAEARSKKILDGNLKDIKRRNSEGLLRMTAKATVAEIGGPPRSRVGQGGRTESTSWSFRRASDYLLGLPQAGARALTRWRPSPRKEPDLEEIYIDAVRNAGIEETAHDRMSLVTELG